MIPGTGANVIHKGASTSHALAFLKCVALLLCFCFNSWGACVDVGVMGGYIYYHANGSQRCAEETCRDDNLNLCGSVQGSSYFGSLEEIHPCWYRGGYACGTYLDDVRYVGCRRWNCDTQAEADSVKCALNPTADGCKEEDVPQNCQEQYAQCMGLGGVWEKVSSDQNGCTSYCDICNSKQQVNNLNRFNRVCCTFGMAPPPQDVICVPPPLFTGYGMSTSILLDDGYETGCGALSTGDGQVIQENADLFKRFCVDGEQYEESSDSNDPGSSSSGGGGESASSSADAGTNCVGDECLPEIYGVLDTIRDTLIHKLAPDVEGIKDCLYSFRLCAQLDSIKIDWSNMPKDSSWLHIDTTLLKYIKPLMDSSVALDSNQLKVLKNLDTNMLKQMGLDTAMLKLDSTILSNDSSTRKAIVSGDSGIMKRVGHVDTSVRRLDSSLTKSIGTLDTSLTKSLGGIDTTLHGLDSSLNRGVRDGVDSLIDSMSRYIGRADSSIRGIGGDGTPLGDSLGKIIGILGGTDTGSVGSGPYGDTANALGDSIRKWIGQGEGQWDSAFRATEGEWGVDTIDGLYDSSFAYGTCHGDDCPPCTDSDCLGKITPAILKYGDSIAAQLGDTLVKNVKAQEDSLPTMWDSAMVKLREVSFFSTFDSTFLANIGAKIPNTNTCPEDCFRQDVNGRYAYVAYNMTLDWKLCRPIAPGVLNGLNAFDILKLLARVLTVVTCLFILMWEVSSRRGGGMGL